MISDYVLKPLQHLINRYLALDSGSKSQLVKMAGKTFAIDNLDFNWQIFLSFDNSGVRIHSTHSGLADASVNGSTVALTKMAVALTQQQSLKDSGVHFRGDMEFSQEVNQLFSGLDIDWEEQLAKITGDFIAHNTSNLAKSTLNWLKQAKSSLRQNCSEHLQEELRLTPGAEELEDFYQDIAQLSNDCERLAARVKRLGADRAAD